MLGAVLYITISPERVTARDIKSGKTFSEVPQVAYVTRPKVKILGMGAEARAHVSDSAVTVVNPFGHPRSLVSDFNTGAELLRQVVRRVAGGSLLSLSPALVLHPQGTPEGGYTQIERRALREMGYAAGARSVDVWTGQPPTDQELLNWKFGSRD